jgi:hypothetical protein
MPVRERFDDNRSDFSLRSISIELTYIPRNLFSNIHASKTSHFKNSLNFLSVPNQRDFQSLKIPNLCEYGCTVCDIIIFWLFLLLFHLIQQAHDLNAF